MSSRWEKEEVGIWRLRAQLGFYLKKVEQGREIIVTRRGRRIARIGRLVAITLSILCAGI